MKKLEELLNMPDSKEIVQKEKEQASKVEKKMLAALGSPVQRQ